MKDIAVIGLGKFGSSVALNYARMGGNVLAIDNDSEKVQEISEEVTYAVKADVTDPEEVKALGLSNMDVVVISIAEDLEASIMATILAKEEGVPYVIAKSYGETHEKVLRKVGADMIISPEKDMGMKVARRLAVNNLLELIELSDEIAIAEVKVLKNWVGKTLIELDLRKKYGFNVVAVKRDGKMDAKINPDAKFEDGTTLFVIGEIKVIEKMFR